MCSLRFEGPCCLCCFGQRLAQALRHGDANLAQKCRTWTVFESVFEHFQKCPVDTHCLCKSEEEPRDNATLRSIPQASLPAKEPEIVQNVPPMNIEPIRSVGPDAHVVVPRTGLAAGEGEQLPRGGLHDGQWRQPEF